MKHVLKLTAFAAVLGFFSCSPASKGKSAGDDYCECNKKEGIIEIAKCKKEVMENNKENLDDLEFQEAFWKAVGDCE
ncbi:MAG: hypothetical protein LBR52_01560 [Prevotellaceae bacterium]|jgi:hypothetical protein|nr:hypothetical protein [Prevotellaceae bacterium]